MYVSRRTNALRGLGGLDERLTGSIGALARDRFAPIEDWRVVGDPAQPAFRFYHRSNFTGSDATAGIRYDHHGSGFAPVSFYRDTAGVVHLRGALARVGDRAKNAEGAYGWPPFAMPYGYRPVGGGEVRRFSQPKYLGDEKVFGRAVVDIGAAKAYYPDDRGVVDLQHVFAGDVVFLDGIRFQADPSEIPPFNELTTS